MILVPGRFIYLATPATASRTIAEALVNRCGGHFLSKTHHAHLSDMPLLDAHCVPVYSLIRDPYDYVLSRYFFKYRHAVNRSDAVLEKFISKYSLESHSSPFGSKMCMYRKYVDKYFLYEDGPQEFFNAVGFPDVAFGKIGVKSGALMGERLKIDDVQPVIRELIDQHFAEEVELYQQVKNQ
jgi:hypothetical protein